MIRDGDSNPSFTVNRNKEIWYDHGLGKGGSIIDLAMRLFETDSIPEVIRRINELYNNALLPEIRKYSTSAVNTATPSNKIVRIQRLGNNQALLAYLTYRGVLREALSQDILKEIYYDHRNNDGSISRYFGIGWQNVSEGWDLRSNMGKICINKKDFLYSRGKTRQSIIFEGMFDFLSALKENPALKEDHLFVLNSLSMSGRVIHFLLSSSDIDRIALYLDHGKGGREFTEHFKKHFPTAEDRSWLYKGYDDYNEKIMASITTAQTLADGAHEESKENRTFRSR